MSLRRLTVVVVLVAACRDREAAPVPPPVGSPPPRSPSPAAPPSTPRGADEIDGFGVGRLALGTPATELASLGFGGDGPRGHGSFTQDGKSVGTVRVGFSVTLRRDGVDVITVDVEPARERVHNIVITGPGPKTREGIGIGATPEAVARAYGAPEDTYGGCRQYALRPGVDFCAAFGAPVSIIKVPALRRSPLTFGEDLAAIAATLDRYVVGARDSSGPRPPLVAPCMLADRTAVIARAGVVYVTAGGWRRPDGSIVICARFGDVYLVDARGSGTRWSQDNSERDRWRVEPAECTVAPTHVECRGVSEMTWGFDGAVVGDLVVESDHLASTRAIRKDGAPTDDCDRILERAWQELAPTRAFLHLPSDAAARFKYLDDQHAHRFIDECTRASDDDRLCLAAAREVLRPAPRCPMGPPNFDLRAQAPALEPARALSAAERRARERALVGKWRRKQDPVNVEWKFTAAGRATLWDSPPGRYSVERDHELIIDDDGSKSVYSIAHDGPGRFYMSDQSIFCGTADIPLPTQDTLVIRDGVCKTVEPTGALRDATCAMSGTSIHVSYDGWLGDPHAMGLERIDGCLVDSTLAPFERQ